MPLTTAQSAGWKPPRCHGNHIRQCGCLVTSGEPIRGEPGGSPDGGGAGRSSGRRSGASREKVSDEEPGQLLHPSSSSPPPLHCPPPHPWVLFVLPSFSASFPPPPPLLLLFILSSFSLSSPPLYPPLLFMLLLCSGFLFVNLAIDL